MKIGEAIQAIQHNKPTSGYQMMCEALDLAVAALREQEERRWIPVTERLPETSQDVLITKRKEFGTVRVMKAFYISSDDEGIWASERGTDTAGVIAWLPLPEPYTAKVEDDDNARRVKPLEFDRFKNDTLKDAQPTAPAHWEKADIPLPYQVRTVPMPNGTFAHREMYVCSACDGYNDKNTQNCPHCGAKMDRKDGNG